MPLPEVPLIGAADGACRVLLVSVWSVRDVRSMRTPDHEARKILDPARICLRCRRCCFAGTAAGVSRDVPDRFVRVWVRSMRPFVVLIESQSCSSQSYLPLKTALLCPVFVLFTCRPENGGSGFRMRAFERAGSCVCYRPCPSGSFAPLCVDIGPSRGKPRRVMCRPFLLF